MENLKKQCEELGFNLVIDEVGLTAMATKIKSKSRFPKPEFNYRFRSKERMVEFVEQFISQKLEYIKRKEERKEAVKKAKEEMGFMDRFTYVVTNDDVDEAVETIRALILQERFSAILGRFC